MKAIMYHYVQDFNSDFPHFKFLDFENFKRQLDYFESEFGFIEQDEFIDSINKKYVPNGIVLTFDDGLKCHYKFVYKELKRRNLWGIFYIPTKAIENNYILDVHMIHIILGVIEDKKLYDYLLSLTKNVKIENNKIIDFKKFTYNTQNNSDYTLFVKRTLNYFIPYNLKKDILIDIINKFKININKIAKSYYLSSAEIVEMQKNNMIIGSHTYDHPVMSRLNIDDQKFQIEQSFKFLEKLLPTPKIKTFCYPYGGFHSFNQNTEQILEDNGCIFSFNVEQRDIEISDILNKPQALPRYDCNQFKFGQINKI